jgi:4'-phosphopantetheinyl transferase
MPHVELTPVRLEAPAGEIDRLFAILSDDEKARARRFATEVLRTRFTVARATLRTLLGRRLERDPRSLVFAYGERGKPSLPGVSFNLSHSGALAVYAIADAEVELGVDVEEIRPMRDMNGIARRFFAPGEADTLAALPEALQTEAFFRCWTRKEAYVKARGDGIIAALDRFEVTFHPDHPPALLHIDGDAAAAAEWHVHHFVPAPGYVAALVVPRGQVWKVNFSGGGGAKS